MAKHIAKTVCVFKVVLRGAKNIWRRIAVRSDQTLDELHEAIFDAFDREEEHLYSFYFPRPGAKGRHAHRDAPEYTHSAVLEEDDLVQDAAKTPLRILGLKPRQRILYLFDFGDSWWHELTVESVDTPAEPGDYPRVLESKGKSPPQYPEGDEE